MKWTFRCRPFLILPVLLLVVVSAAAAGQGPPKTIKLDGPTATGALRCAPDESVQFALIGLDENLNSTSLGQYAPQARSTSETVVVARVGDEAATRVNVLCVGDGEAWITVEAAGVRADVPVLVGTARRKASPKGPHPELAQIASGRGSVAQGQQAIQSPVTGEPAQLPITLRPAENPAQLPITLRPGENPAQLPITVRPGENSSQLPITVRPDSGANARAVSRGASSDLKAGVSSGGSTPTTARSDRIGAQATSTLTPPTAEPTAVHATNFKAFAGYGRNVLTWIAAPGAAGYRLDRSIWDPVKQAMVAGSRVEIPNVPVADASGLIDDTNFTDVSVKAGTQYVYWLRTHFKSASGGFYFPLSGEYPAITVTPRDPAGMTWLPSDWARPPRLLSIVPSSTGLSVEWAPKGGTAGYIILRTPQGTPFDLQEYEKCMPSYVYSPVGSDKPLVQAENRIDVTIAPDVVRRMCFGIFAIYPDEVVDGTPVTRAFSNWPPSKKGASNRLIGTVHSKGLFIWAEWDSSLKKWRVLPQGSFPIAQCILDDKECWAL